MNRAKRILSLKSQKWNKSSKTEDQPHLKVDREKGIIYDVVLAQVGPAKGHGTICEMPFISKIVDEGTKREAGIKVHFGHPSMSEQTLGSYTARAFNHRLKGNQAIADLHLSEVAKKSPKGNLYDYLLDLAEKEPDMFGMSVVTAGNKYHIKNGFGDYQEITDETDIDEDTEIFETFTELCAVDFVSEGALTPGGLFSIEFNRDKFAVQVTDFLDNHKSIDDFINENPTKLVEFMNKRYGKSFGTIEKKSIFDSIREIFTSNKNSKAPLKKYMEEFDINATTSEGVAITIISESETTPSTGDAIVDASTGDPVSDGSHTIADDSAAIPGYVLAVEGGVITEITAPELSEDEAENEATEPAEVKNEETIESLKAALVVEKKKNAAMNAQMKRAAGGDFTPLFNAGSSAGKTVVLSDNQKMAIEAQKSILKKVKPFKQK